MITPTFTKHWVVPPPRMPVANEGLVRDPPTKNVIILVVTVTGRGNNPNQTKQKSPQTVTKIVTPEKFPAAEFSEALIIHVN